MRGAAVICTVVGLLLVGSVVLHVVAGTDPARATGPVGVLFLIAGVGLFAEVKRRRSERR
jgi:hypothetical protein